MGQILLHERFYGLKTRTANLVSGLLGLCARAGREDLEKTASGLLSNLGEPFLFVVIGEVKTGKSSFINALLGEEICKVAPDPCTDQVRIISHGQGLAPGQLSGDVEHVHLPLEILKDIAVVDTPGIDSIIERHQEITQDFIPRCDLVFFVFSALNPYSKSAWDFLRLIADKWRRKIVFVLNQADLASPNQLEVNSREVLDYAARHAVTGAKLFLTASPPPGQGEPAGQEEVRSYIREMVTGGRHFASKLESVAQSGQGLLAGLRLGFELEAQVLANDAAESLRAAQRLAAMKKLASRELEILIGKILTAYSEQGQDLLEDFKAELSFSRMLNRCLGGLWRRGRSEPAWQEQLAGKFREKVREQCDELTGQGAQRIIEDLSAGIEELLREVRHNLGKSLKSPDFAQLSRQREAVLKSVDSRLQALLLEREFSRRLSATGVSGLDPRASLGGAMLVLAAILAVSVKGAVFDVTGGVLAASGVLLTGGALAISRPRYLRTLRKALDDSKPRLRDELSERLNAQLEAIFREFESAFAPLAEHVAKRQELLDGLGREAAQIEAKLEELSEELNLSLG